MKAEARVCRELVVVPYVERAERHMIGASALAKAEMQPRFQPVATDYIERQKRTMFDHDVPELDRAHACARRCNRRRLHQTRPRALKDRLDLLLAAVDEQL